MIIEKLEKKFEIGKVASFQEGYIFLRYNYSNFLKYSQHLKIGNFLLISSLHDNTFLVGQITNIYDTINQQEEEIRISIANNGDISSLERDIYLFIEVKIKPLFIIENNEIFFNKNDLTLRLKSVYYMNNELKSGVFFKIFNNFDKYSFYITLNVQNQIKLWGLIVSLGNFENFLSLEKENNVIDLRKIKKNIKFNENFINKILILNYDNFLKFFDYKFLEKNVVILEIKNRIELIKLASDYIAPDFIIGKNLLPEDYRIIQKITFLKNDYISFFCDKFFIIYQGIVFTSENFSTT